MASEFPHSLDAKSAIACSCFATEGSPEMSAHLDPENVADPADDPAAHATGEEDGELASVAELSPRTLALLRAARGADEPTEADASRVLRLVLERVLES